MYTREASCNRYDHKTARANYFQKKEKFFTPRHWEIMENNPEKEVNKKGDRNPRGQSPEHHAVAVVVEELFHVDKFIIADAKVRERHIQDAQG